MSDKSIPEASVDTRLLRDRLLKLNHDETVSYAELSEVIGRDVQTVARSNLASARRMAEREGVILDAVSRVGIKRLTSGAAADSTGPRIRERIRRAASRGARRIAVIPFAELTAEQRIKTSAEASHLGALRAFAADKQTRKIEQQIDKQQPQQLALAKTIKVFET